MLFSCAKKICFLVWRQGRISRKINLKFFRRLVSSLRTISQTQHEPSLKNKSFAFTTPMSILNTKSCLSTFGIFFFHQNIVWFFNFVCIIFHDSFYFIFKRPRFKKLLFFLMENICNWLCTQKKSFSGLSMIQMLNKILC